VKAGIKIDINVEFGTKDDIEHVGRRQSEGVVIKTRRNVYVGGFHSVNVTMSTRFEGYADVAEKVERIIGQVGLPREDVLSIKSYVTEEP
jgi:hypothetical protein